MTGIIKNIFEILEAEKDNLFQYASYRVRDIRDVEDAMQNLYVKVLSRPERFADISNRRAYLYRMLCSECADIVRASGRTEPLFDDSKAIFPEMEISQPENFEEEFTMINRLLAMLPAEQSEAIRLRHHSNLSFQEIADVMGVPLPTAKARYRYGIEKIRATLKKKNLI